MKLKNKKTGEIATLTLSSNGEELLLMKNNEIVTRNVELSDLEEWEDYEEPKDNNYWYIDDFGRIQFSSEILDEVGEHPNNWMARKLFGNYFGTREEAEKAVEKLKAWKRMKDKGFRFEGIAGMGNEIYFKANEQFTHIMVDEYTADKTEKEYINDLMLLFGGEE